MRYRHIIWDWNGTLVDDAELTVELTNAVLNAAGSPSISLDEHRSVFQLPIIEYYRAIGLPIAPETVAAIDHCFHKSYDESRHRLRLFPDVTPTLQSLVERDCNSSILSALPQRLLTEHLEHLNLTCTFKKAVGRSTTHAESKVENGRKLIAELALNPSDILIVGDTIYDHEVAAAIGADSALIARGHQSAARLQAANPTHLTHSLNELFERLRAG